MIPPPMSRVAAATVSDRPSTAYAYDDCGELARTTRDGVSVSESRTYERDPDDGELYRVARAYRTTVGSSSPVLVRETRTRLTGLSKDGLLSRRVEVGEDGRETVEEKRPMPEGFVYSDLFETARWTEGETPTSTLTRLGLAWYESSMDGTRLYDYDALGRVCGIDCSDWMCGDTWLDYSYDESGNVVEVVDSVSQLSSVGHARTRIAYDRLGRETTREDTFGHVVTNAYDALGQPALATGDRHPVSTGYDAAGNRTRLATTRDGGATWDATQWEYAVPGGQATAKVYADSSRVAYTRTQEGWPVRTTWARGAWKEYAYDGHGNVTDMSYSSMPSVSLSYDALDCLVSAENSATGDGHISYACTYDAHRNCTEEAVSVGNESFTLSRTFDEFLRPSSVSVSHGGMSYSTKERDYDSENRVSGCTLGGDGTPGSGLAVSVSYQGHLPVGMLFRFPNGNEMTLALTREPGRATWITRRDYEFTGSPIYWHRTAYDAEGRPTETEDSLTATRQWLYNRRSELVGASGTPAYPYDYAYSYDSIGNRLTSSDDSGTATYAANCLNQYTQVTRNQTPQNLTYDADGNLTQDDRFTYAYDDENRLVSVTPLNPQFGSRSIENVYDHQSRRVKKIVKHFDGTSWNAVETHAFVWDGWNIIFEQITFADNTTRTIEYFWGNDLSGTEQGAGGVGGLLATRIDGVIYIPVYGANGNIMMYVSESGSITAQYDYDPYGNILQATGPLASQFALGFSTKYHDREVGLVAYQLRTYDPVYGRWLNRDPIEESGGENLYMSEGNCLMTMIDPYGLSEYVLGDRVVRFGQLNSSTWDSEKEFGLFNNLTQVWAWNRALVTVGVGKMSGLNASAGMLWHFLDDSGDIVIVPIDQIMKEDSSFATCMRTQIEQAMIFAEKLVCKNKVPTLISATKMDAFSLGGLNWGFAIHCFSASARALVTKCGKKYQMNWHFYLHDLYDWDLQSEGRGGLVTDRQMAMLHRNGFAREYPVSGRYDIEVSWQKGERLKSNFYETVSTGMVSPNYVLIR